VEGKNDEDDFHNHDFHNDDDDDDDDDHDDDDRGDEGGCACGSRIAMLVLSMADYGAM